MIHRILILTSLLLLVATVATVATAEPVLEQPHNTWLKRSPLKTAPVSPGMGYEAALAYDPIHRRVIRWGGHNQGGGGEQNGETWVLDPVTMKWELKEPNRSPPGACCAQQDVFDPGWGRFLRFPAFSGNHGWHWFRENYLNNSSVWSYDLATNTWRDLRPLPALHPAPLRCASWDSHHQVAVIFGGEGSQDGTILYDPYTNTWKRMQPKGEPAARSGGNMTYDSARRLHILFGSQFTDDPHTWAYDVVKNEWRDLKPAVQPPTNRNDAVLAYDAAHQVVVAVVRVADKQSDNDVLAGHLQTWAYDTGKNAWTRMRPPREPDGWGNRRRIMVAIPDQQLILMEAYVNPTERVPGVDREQQIWTYRYGAIKKGGESAENIPARTQPRIVEDATACVISAKRVELTWKPPAGPDVAGYHIERAVVEVFSEDEVLRLKKDTPPLAEPSVGAIRAIGPFTVLTKEPIKETTYTDTHLDLTKRQRIEGEPIFTHRFRADQLDPKGKPYRYAVYAYRIRAVNAVGEKSGPSPYLLTIPSAPQGLFSREEGEKCHLKWTANLEKGPKGYRVYRMEGPRINGPGQKVTRLTFDPLVEARYTDPAAGKDTRRYWVVAVDALDQEGFPSSPAWHYRQWRKYYEPFTSEWHQ